MMTGKQKRVTVTIEKNTAKSRKRAQAILTEKINKALSLAPNTDLSLRDLVEKYEEEQEKTLKKSTYRRNFYSCNTIMSMLGPDILVNKITSGYIRKCLLATGKKPGTLNEHLVRIKALLRWGVVVYDVSLTVLVEEERRVDTAHFLQIDRLAPSL